MSEERSFSVAWFLPPLAVITVIGFVGNDKVLDWGLSDTVSIAMFVIGLPCFLVISGLCEARVPLPSAARRERLSAETREHDAEAGARALRRRIGVLEDLAEECEMAGEHDRVLVLRAEVDACKRGIELREQDAEAARFEQRDIKYRRLTS